MSTQNSCSFSDELVAYLIGEVTKEEKNMIEDHLLTCSSCRIILEELQEAWNMIPTKLDNVEVPADLKEAVMNSIFREEKGTEETTTPKEVSSVVNKINRFQLYRWAAALIFLALVGATWNNLILRNQLKELTNTPLFPAEVIQVFNLKSADPSNNTKEGKAWLYQLGDKKQLVFQVQGLDGTKGTEAYQVWLIHKGKRSSAGVFRVDAQGNGFLQYELKEAETAFEAIGISLEPDANGIQPRGQKVLGT
ncbi:anti-sigma factor [Neobacillus vireti]|uniref:anti-sigma factor n=1 Tax=Neobacillus vireti TaxID=220686 RepID=UPI002FFE1881